ncbi:hypothetical protein [Nocardia sp. Marseille-Q1738]
MSSAGCACGVDQLPGLLRADLEQFSGLIGAMAGDLFRGPCFDRADLLAQRLDVVVTHGFPRDDRLPIVEIALHRLGDRNGGQVGSAANGGGAELEPALCFYHHRFRRSISGSP